MAFASPGKGGKFLPVPGAPTAAPKSQPKPVPAGTKGSGAYRTGPAPARPAAPAPVRSGASRPMQPSAPALPRAPMGGPSKPPTIPAAPKGPYIGGVSKYGKGTGKKK